MEASSTTTTVCASSVNLSGVDELQRFGHRQPAIPGAVLHRLIDRLAGRREHQHLLVGAVRGRAQRVQRVRLARAGGRLQRLHQKRRHRDGADRARLIGRQTPKVVGAHIQPRTVGGRIDHAQDALLLGDHRVDGEFLVPFAVVCARAVR